MNSFSKIKEKRSINSTKTNKENQPTKKERTKRKELKKKHQNTANFYNSTKTNKFQNCEKINTKRKKVNKKSLKVPNIRISQNKSKTCEYDPQNEKELYLKRIIIKSEINSSTVFQLNKRKNQNLTLTSHEMTNKDWVIDTQRNARSRSFDSQSKPKKKKKYKYEEVNNTTITNENEQDEPDQNSTSYSKSNEDRDQSKIESKKNTKKTKSVKKGRKKSEDNFGKHNKKNNKKDNTKRNKLHTPKKGGISNDKKKENQLLSKIKKFPKIQLSGKKKKKNKRKENSNHNNNENNVQGGGKGLKNKKPQPRKWLKKRDEIFDDQTQFHSNLGLDTTINKKINKKLDKNILNNKNRNTNVNSFNNAGETKKVRIRNVGTIKYKKSLLKTIKFDRDGNPTFDSILNHFLIDFIEFSASEYNDENILFWSRANEFKEYCQQRKTKLARQMAYKIYKSHIIENSEKEINISGPLRSKIINSFNRNSLICPPPNIFNEAQKNVYEIMSGDLYLSFLRSSFFQSVSKNLGKVQKN
ncbi:regulator of g protein signaling-related [Anaeramoeba flamelloides]|uniref:Regulator of g protein signaling-related n=1 Tax=Anaeramoeba flamelloides TaxID=1746091 RepID=A0ABQ8Y3L7_9EUKA|nr:regulator of g protein signaling-related [Anaeramoeba flamelloides]